METNSQLHKEKAMKQIREALARVIYTQTTQYKHADKLCQKFRVIKTLQIVLSAVSTGGFLGSLITNEILLVWLGGVFSTVLLALNLFIREINVTEEMKQHRKTADDLWLIRERYVSLLTDFDILDSSSIIARRDALQKDTYDIYKDALPTSKKSYHEAQKALKLEEEQYFSDEELDQIVPVHLK
jgi:hypothetical protein